MENCITRIKELERLFSDNQYNGSGQTAFFMEEGNMSKIHPCMNINL